MSETANGRATLRDVLEIQKDISEKLDTIHLRIGSVETKITGVENRARGLATGYATGVSIAFGIVTMLLDYLIKR